MSTHDDLAGLASDLLRIRRGRTSELPAELFSEPAWDLLLELFVADAQGHRLTGREVGTRCAIPATVMTMWLRHLTKTGLLLGDGVVDLDAVLTLSRAALEKMARVLTRSITPQDALHLAD